VGFPGNIFALGSSGGINDTPTEELPAVRYPTAWCRIQLKLEDFGQGNAEDLLVLEYIPLEAKVTKNSFDEADIFRVKIDFEEFPLDPRIIEGASCEIYMAGSDGLDADFWEKQSLDFMREHCEIIGVVDSIKGGIGEEGRITELTGRDYTAYFLDAQVDVTPVSYLAEDGVTKLTFVEVIEKVLAQRPTTEAITIRDPDLVEKIYPGDYKQGGDDPKTAKRKKKKKETVWEALRDIAIEAGHVIYVDLDEIVIRKPRTIFVGEPQDQSKWLRFTIGYDVKEFHPSRKMGRQQGIRVRCTSFLDQDHKRLVAVYPEAGFTKTEIKAKKIKAEGFQGGGTGENAVPSLTFRSYVFRGIKTEDHLKRIAKELYALVSHHELEGSFTTEEMVDSNGKPVWAIRYGDPITFGVAESLASIITLDMEAQIAVLVEYGYGEEAARALMLSIDQASVPFYIHSVMHEFRVEDEGGFTMTAEIRSRRQVDITGANEPGPED